MLEFLQVFYLTATVFSNIYIPSNHIALYNIYVIIKYFTKYKDHNQLETITVPMEVKFMKYYKKFTTIILLQNCFGP